MLSVNGQLLDVDLWLSWRSEKVPGEDVRLVAWVRAAWNTSYVVLPKKTFQRHSFGWYKQEIRLTRINERPD